jgi:hypothetical protein
LPKRLRNSWYFRGFFGRLIEAFQARAQCLVNREFWDGEIERLKLAEVELARVPTHYWSTQAFVE